MKRMLSSMSIGAMAALLVVSAYFYMTAPKVNPNALKRGDKLTLLNIPAEAAMMFAGCEYSYIAEQTLPRGTYVFMMIDKCTNAPPDVLPVVLIVDKKDVKKLVVTAK